MATTSALLAVLLVAATASGQLVKYKGLQAGHHIDRTAQQQYQIQIQQQQQQQQRAVAPPKAPALDELTRSGGVSQQRLDDRQAAVVALGGGQQQQIKRTKTDDEQAKLFQEQARNAKYSFDTLVEDGIMDHAHLRTETRDGLKVEGMYSYSDGFFRRTIQYEADENGYRVVKEEVEPIGDGPIVDLKTGAAVVKSSLGTDYKITVDDLVEKPTLGKKELN